MEFTCPKCGGHYFGRDSHRGPDGEIVLLDTVRCHGGGSLSHEEVAAGKKSYDCNWRGEYVED